MSRILRCLVCFLLICCILVNLSPLKSNATGIGAAAGIASAAGVSVPALWPIVAALAVVGVTAYGIESGAFEQVANSCYSALEAAGTWIQDGQCTILRTTDENGNTQFYVDGGMIADIKDWLFSDTATESGPVVYEGTSLGTNILANVWISSPIYDSNFKAYPASLYSAPVLSNISYCLTSDSSGAPVLKSWYLYVSDSSFSITTKIGSYTSPAQTSKKGTIGGRTLYYIWYASSFSKDIEIQLNNLKLINAVEVSSVFSSLEDQWNYFYPSFPYALESSADVALGYLPSEDLELDESTIVSFHPYLAQVIQTKTGGSGGSGDGEDKWWLAAAYAETLEQLYQTSQQAQIENPSVVEIPDLQEGTQYEVTVEEDEDGNKKYILNPIYDPGSNPGTGTDPGTDPDVDPNPDSGNGSGDNTGSNTGNPGSGGVASAPSVAPSHFGLGDLSKFFPFCIPFDLFDFFKLLNADPVAPEFSWTIQDLSGQSYSLTIDLSEWDSVAQLFRRLQLFLFVCGLAAASRKFIKW